MKKPKCEAVCRDDCPSCGENQYSSRNCRKCSTYIPAKLCKHPAGFRTDHPGDGKCYLHGGKTPIQTGRYSRIKRPRIRELIEELQASGDHFDLVPEVVLLRAVIIDYTERYDEITEALIAWNHYQAADKQRPVRVLQLSDLSSMISQLAGIVERAHKMKEVSIFTLDTLNRIMEQMAISVRNRVARCKGLDASSKRELLNNIQEDWVNLKASTTRL